MGKDLRASNEQLSRQVSDLQVKHDAAQSHLDAAITQQITPRTRRNLDSQARLLQPALGRRLASSFVESRHHKALKERASRELSISRSCDSLAIDACCGADAELVS